MTTPPSSPEPTAVGAVSSAIAIRVTSRRWFSFLRSATALRFLCASLATALLAYIALPHLVCLEVLEREKLADCTTNRISFTMTCVHTRPYALLLGIPTTNTVGMSFKGDLRITQGQRKVVRLPLSSDDMTPCSWLESGPRLTGYILTWRTHRADLLSDSLQRGQSYQVEVTFAEVPPSNSSLWLSSMGRPRLW